MKNLISSMLFSALLVGCGSKPVVPEQKPIIKTIAIIPASPPQEYEIRNYTAIQFFSPIVGAGYALDSRQKSKVFTQSVVTRSPDLGEALTQSVVTELIRLGYTVNVINDIARKPDDPDNVDLEKLGFSEDAAVHVMFSDVGLVSTRTSVLYLSRVNAEAKVLAKNRDDYLFDDRVYYGVDAQKDDDWTIPANEPGAYSSFEDIQTNIDIVIARFRIGAQEAGRRLALKINDAIK